MNNYLPSVSGSSTTKGRRAKRKSNLNNSLIRVINKRLAHLNGVGNFSYFSCFVANRECPDINNSESRLLRLGVLDDNQHCRREQDTDNYSQCHKEVEGNNSNEK